MQQVSGAQQSQPHSEAPLLHCSALLTSDAPIQTEYLRSGGATTLIFMDDGASSVISLDMRSAMPGNMEVPPDSTMLPYRSLRMSTSHLDGDEQRGFVDGYVLLECCRHLSQATQ